MSKTHLQGDDVRYLALVGRQLFSVIFIIASAGHFTPGTIAQAAEHGVPMAGLLVPVSGLIALAGGLSVLFGYRARVGGALLAVFLVPVTFTMHNFWAAPDASTFRLELLLFLRNIVLLGCAVLVTKTGAGSLSLDAAMESRPLEADSAA
ncbi:MAG: DoxX family protein [Acidobacteria bacterium]|nr:MAG: DoxX family protein [Acidobacteriota bacterium]